MARTRTSKPAAGCGQAQDTGASTKPTLQQLEPSEQHPPQVIVWPKDASPEARITTIPNPATTAPTRYLVCPRRGFYEFTKITPPKSQKRSWLLAPDRMKNRGEDGDTKPIEGCDEELGRVLQSPDMLVATPIDPLFLLLHSLLGEQSAGQEYLASSDYTAKLGESSSHLRHMLETSASTGLQSILESRIEAVSDCMDMGDEKMYALSLPKLVKELVSKAKRMAAHGLPTTMEDRFVKQALDVPVLSMKREESSVSIVTEDVSGGAESHESSAMESQDSNEHNPGTITSGTVATSVPISDEATPSTHDSQVKELLRLRVALDFMLTSYVLPKLKKRLEPLLVDTKVTGVDFSPLDKHLEHIDSLKKEALALRSLSDNISRKRANHFDDEAVDKAADKKRKREEENAKKQNMTHGVKKLMKVNTTGMKKMSSFFTKATPNK